MIKFNGVRSKGVLFEGNYFQVTSQDINKNRVDFGILNKKFLQNCCLKLI